MSGERFGWSSTAEDVARNVDLSGKQVVLTGASSGIGVETARTLGAAGADLVLGVRDPAKGQAALGEICPAAKASVRLLSLDLADLASVARFAAQVPGPVDVLIANAGVSKTPDAHLPNGLDVRFATNHLGHFLLAHLLKQRMAGHGARIVVVSSAAHKGMPVRLDDLQWTTRKHFDGAAYAESKSANILFAQEATRRWSGEGIFANAVLPGSALTGLQRFHGDALKRKIGFINADGSVNEMVKTTAQAAATSVWAATAPELKGRGGLVLEDCGEALPVGSDTHPWMGFDSSVADPETARRLWEHSLELVRRIAGDIV
ncbi:MAG: SDR family NAD(P)-dependent oxidoreductase [Novosphingobium sp.]|nr:SDR family NAD(P)-dependent oxidoreductase [Novosphingobium sp.]MCP5402482.1 SDR family NAD(P)-dependent oxidoreductase [Novosphingobium sp.]